MNRRIFLSILLALCSSVGLILFQVLWLSRTYFETEWNFYVGVSSALTKAMDDDARIRHAKNDGDSLISYVASNYENATTVILYTDGTRKKKLYNIIEEHLNESARDHHELVHINLHSLSNLYRTYLDSLQILLPFILEEIDVRSGEVVSSTLSETDKNEYNFSSITYPWGIFEEKAIRAKFISPYAMVVKQMRILFVSSIILIVLLLFTVIFLLQTIFHQKKIAEIRTDFVNVVVHELKNPLLYITKYLELRKKDETLVGIEHNSKRMTQMVNKLLSATIKDERLLLDRTDVDLAVFLQAIVTQYQYKIPENCLFLFIHDEEVPLRAHVDRLHLENALVNLIDNAVKYCQETPRIIISIHRKNNLIYISVKDNGIGITKREQHFIFDKYYRVREKSGSVKRHGFGLGLSYVKMVTKAHNGKIHVISKPDEGSEFILIIPM